MLKTVSLFNYKMMKEYLNSKFDFSSDELIDVIDELPRWSAPFGLKLLDNIRLKRGISVLDIGFGTGFPLIEMAAMLGKDSTVYGIDPWKAMVKRTEKKLAIYNIENVKLISGVAEDIPLPDNAIDLITSNNGINNVKDLDKTFSECLRVLKSGGQFLQTMNLNTTMIEFYEIMESVLKDLDMLHEIENMHEQIYKMRKPLDEFIHQIEQHGFSVTHVVNDQFDYKYIDGTTMFNNHFIRMAFLDGWKSFIPSHRYEEVFSLVEDRINEIAEVNGYFKLSIPFVLIDSTKP